MRPSDAARNGQHGQHRQDGEAGGDPQGVDRPEGAHGYRGERGADDGHDALHRLLHPDERLEVPPIALGHCGKQGVAGRHAGHVPDGSEHAEQDEPAEGEPCDGIDHGQGGDAGGRHEIRRHRHVPAVQAVEERPSHDAGQHLGDGADQGEASGSEHVARSREEDEGHDDPGDGVPHEGRSPRNDVARRHARPSHHILLSAWVSSPWKTMTLGRGQGTLGEIGPSPMKCRLPAFLGRADSSRIPQRAASRTSQPRRSNPCPWRFRSFAIAKMRCCEWLNTINRL